MCLIALAYKVHKEYPVLFAANRDEFYKRETQQMHWWEDGILAGKDLEASGTWFGANKKGQWAALTNYRNLKLHGNGKASRGLIIPKFLKNENSTLQFLKSLKAQSDFYNPFNVFLSDGADVYYFNNIQQVVRKLTPGIYSLSNAFLNSNWPKSRKITQAFEAELPKIKSDSDVVFDLLNDKERAEKSELPNTGVGEDLESILSAVFIESPAYGTRCSTFMSSNAKGKMEIWEKTYVPQLNDDLKHFSLKI